MELSRHIRNLRYAKGWGLDELANRAQISRTALYQIERGTTSKPQANTLKRISRALNVPLESLLRTAPLTTDASFASLRNGTIETPLSIAFPSRASSAERAQELMEKFLLLLGSPLADTVSRIVEDSCRLLPIIPPPVSGVRTRRGHRSS